MTRMPEHLIKRLADEDCFELLRAVFVSVVTSGHA